MLCKRENFSLRLIYLSKYLFEYAHVLIVIKYRYLYTFYFSLSNYFNSFNSILSNSIVIEKHWIEFRVKKTCIHVEAAVTHILTPVGPTPIIAGHEGRRERRRYAPCKRVRRYNDRQGEAVPAVNRDENVKWLEIVDRGVMLPAAILWL